MPAISGILAVRTNKIMRLICCIAGDKWCGTLLPRMAGYTRARYLALKAGGMISKTVFAQHPTVLVVRRLFPLNMAFDAGIIVLQIRICICMYACMCVCVCVCVCMRLVPWPMVCLHCASAPLCHGFFVIFAWKVEQHVHAYKFLA